MSLPPALRARDIPAVTLPTSPLAARARNWTLNGNGLTRTAQSIEQIKIERVLQIFTWLSMSAGTSAKPTKKVTKKVLKRGKRAAPPPAEFKSTTAPPLSVRPHSLRVEARLQPFFAKLIVQLALLWVAQDVMSKGQFLEPLFGVLVARVDIWVVLTSEPTVSFFDLLG
jgi:hypothetical protein